MFRDGFTVIEKNGNPIIQHVIRHIVLSNGDMRPGTFWNVI